jgi:glycosyltransferase involved in cell wall biosynthesis
LFPGFDKIFLFIGRLDKVKNCAWLISIFAQYRKENKSALLVIAGDGAERHNLETLVKQKGLNETVRFVGWISEPLDYIKTADCLLFPSLSEGYGLVAMEAYAAGTKIIMTDVGVAGYELPASKEVAIIKIGDEAGFLKAMNSI